DNDFITYGSSLRDKALCIESLVLAGEGGQSIELAQECADEFEQSGYVSQATAFAAEALCKLASVSATSVKATVNDGHDQSVKAAKPVWSSSVNAATGKISVKNESDGTLYVSLLTVKTPSDGEAVQATSSNITTDIAYYDLKGAPLDVSTLAQGTEFKAVVTVKNFSAGNKSNLALSFNSPAGWTIFNDRLYSGASEAKGYNYMDIRDDRVIWYFDLPTAAEKSFTVRLTANYAGSYTLPATVCEAMYDPKTFAGAPSGKCSVVK
ncbi:MAG: alpha-2-macroglobulin, partial [Bacteroidales bacterium]|nr:alpha-2-macroglobulin [Bacteroidales bacterium]